MIVLLVVSSCANKKNVLYFQDIEKLQNLDINKPDLLVDTGDILSIRLSALNPESILPFQPISNSAESSDGGLTNFLVDLDGNIQYPVLGFIYVKGKSTREITQVLKDKIASFIKNPVVQVRVANFSISILGEVNAPGNYIIPNENITVLDALALAGDMTIFGKRRGVKVIRTKDNQKTYAELDFTSVDLVNSPYFYLKQNDVIIVSPNNAQVQSSAANRNISVFVSLVGLAISVLTILTR